MAEEISNPLLSLVRDQGLIDDLQYEEVAAEFKRSGASVSQLLQDFGIMKLDDILHVMATNLGTEVVSLKDINFSPDLLKTIPANVARMYHCDARGREKRHPCRWRWPSRWTRRMRMRSVLPASVTCRWWWPIPPILRKAVERHYGPGGSG